MYGAGRLRQQNRLTIPVQRFGLSNITDGYNESKQRSFLRWIYKTQPTKLGRIYTILISYRLGKTPDVFVLEPDIKHLAQGRIIPHIYSKTVDYRYKDAVCLCLFRTKYGEWRSCNRLADTIVPWVDLWLFYFEDWLVTDEWKGGGEHPE